MTPQERQLIEELFDRLASLEDNPRDAEAVRVINEGVERAPNALYPLVQTALVQDEALKRADARIRELEAELGIGAGEPANQGSFLDGMRDTLSGRREQRGSVPSVRPGEAPAPRGPWRTTSLGGDYDRQPGAYDQQPGGYTQQPGYAPGGYAAQQQPQQGGSFLGTAAATAAGAIGGALLMNSIRGMMGGGGHGQGQSHSAFGSGSGSGSPWAPNSSNSDLARDAGLNDIGGSGSRTAAQDDNSSQRAGLFDTAQNDADDSDGDDGDFDLGGDTDTA